MQYTCCSDFFDTVYSFNLGFNSWLSVIGKIKIWTLSQLLLISQWCFHVKYMKCRCKTVNCYKYFQSAQKWCSFPSNKDSIVLFQIHKVLCNSHLPSIKYSSTCYFFVTASALHTPNKSCSNIQGMKNGLYTVTTGFCYGCFWSIFEFFCFNFLTRSSSGEGLIFRHILYALYQM